MESNTIEKYMRHEENRTSRTLIYNEDDKKVNPMS